MKVDFIIIGAMKCATTSLATILDTDPSVSLASPKEPNFFLSKNFSPGDYESYHSCFEEGDAEGMIYGEGSTSYTKFGSDNLEIAERIHAYNPTMKLIYITRDPLRRMISHYVHQVQRGREKRGVEQALREDEKFLNVSKYYMQIHPYLQVFKRDQILLLGFDEFVNNRRKFMLKVAQFLGLTMANFQWENTHENSSTTEQKLPPGMDQYFNKYQKLIKRIPSPIRKSIKDLIARAQGRRVTEKPEISRELEGYLRAEVREDYQKYCELLSS